MALAKIQHYCAYQERCHQEVRKKLLDWGVYGDTLDEIMVDLIENNFLNEERFAKIYAGSKFRQQQWGKIRIKQELRQRQISDYCIRKGIEEIGEDDYLKTLEEILRIRAKGIVNGPDKYTKLTQFALRKGFESDLIAGLLRKILKGTDD